MKLDVEPVDQELSAIHLATNDDKCLRVLNRANMLQIIVCRMCLFYDKLLILERLSNPNTTEIASMFKNVLTYSYQSHLLVCWMILQKIPENNSDNKWCVFLREVTRAKLQVTSVDQAVRLVQSNNENVCIVIRSLLKATAVKAGFFETVYYCLQHISKASMRILRELLQQHTLDEADRMTNVKPELVNKLRSSLKQHTDQRNALISS